MDEIDLPQQATFDEVRPMSPALSDDGSTDSPNTETKRRSSVDATKLVRAFAQSKPASNAAMGKNLMRAARAKVVKKSKAAAVEQKRPRTPEAERVEDDEAKSDKHPARVEPWGAIVVNEPLSSSVPLPSRIAAEAVAHQGSHSPSNEDEMSFNTQASVDRVSTVYTTPSAKLRQNECATVLPLLCTRLHIHLLCVLKLITCC